MPVSPISSFKTAIFFSIFSIFNSFSIFKLELTKLIFNNTRRAIIINFFIIFMYYIIKIKMFLQKHFNLISFVLNFKFYFKN